MADLYCIVLWHPPTHAHDSDRYGKFTCFSAFYLAILILLMLSQFGRVYYACHWIGDTIVGSLIGIALGCAIFYLSTQTCGGVESIDLNKIHSADFFASDNLNSPGWYPVFCFSR